MTSVFDFVVRFNTSQSAAHDAPAKNPSDESALMSARAWSGLIEIGYPGIPSANGLGGRNVE
jgi:hypothetical protein